MHLVIRVLGELVMRLFYRSMAATGRERLPSSGPVIVVANHPNGLLDPLVARAALGRPLGFLAKSTFFKSWIGRQAMRAFDAMPVYRPRDGEDTSRNEATFQLCRDRLAKQGWLMLFPEGTSHSDPKLKPLKTGAARIALQAEAANGFSLGVKVLPVGLLYEDKAIFRSRVAVAIGEPIELASLADAYAQDERAAVEALTQAIDRRLSEVVLEADDRELWNGFVAVASWTAADGGRDLAGVQSRAKALAAAWERLVSTAPDRAARVADETRRFATMLRELGIEHPFSLEAPTSPGLKELAAFVLPMILLAPIALVGAALGWLPYRIVGILASRAADEEDVVATAKAIGGLVLLAPWWILVAAGALIAWGPAHGLGLLLLGPLSGFVALRWSERLHTRRQGLRGLWLRWSGPAVVEELRSRRAELCESVNEALRSAPPAS